MRRTLRFIHPLMCAVLLVDALLPATAQVATPSPDVQSCRQFTRAFYDWYVPYTQKNLAGPASDVAMKRKPEVFSPRLLQALKADSEAQARAKGEIVGIDFDPFVNSQDPYDHYTVRQVTIKSGICFAEVRNGTNRNTASEPDVIAELTQQEGPWRFVNFHYPNVNTDLISVLSSLRKERSKR